MRKVLLLYISEHSGHHCASAAIEKALYGLDPSIKTFSINSFNYTNPILEKVINRTYMSVVKRTPEIWDYLYDNPKVLKKTQKLRGMIHRFNTGKLKTLLDEFRPDAIVCTQAFPCGMIADYKKSFNLQVPLIGVLTDYAPHSYWVYDNVDRYIVPSEETAAKLARDGIEPCRIAVFGIPVDPKFGKAFSRERVYEKLSFDETVPVVLVMGGTQGLGPIREFVGALDKSNLAVQIAVATGTNKNLYRWLTRRIKTMRKKTVVAFNADNIDEFMEIAAVIVTKPGGITTAEALAKGLPMLILNPLPGQEAMNTKYLLREGVALKAENAEDAVTLLEELLHRKNKLAMMAANAKRISKPDSAVKIAGLVMELMRR
jgi:processive 1,2-diacylglycerol beta-glucosyltransferase